MLQDTPVDELVGAFGQVVGVEKAEGLVTDAAAALGIEGGGELSTEDVVDICGHIAEQEEGYVAMLAEDLKVETHSERRFNALLENIPDPTVVVRFDGDGPVVKTVNTAFESVFGYGLADVRGEPLESLTRPEDADGPALTPDRLAADRIEREVRRETSEGETRSFLVRSVPIATMSGAAEAAITHTDITDQKRRQRELERKNEQLERFAEVVSHDLRNPLTVASARLDILREELSTADVEDADEHLDAAEHALDQMTRMIDDVLRLARQGRTVGETQPVGLADCARGAWGTVDTGLATVEVDPDLPTVGADPDRLREAFENLFRNAIEHGGEDVVVRVGPTDDGFFVADDGPGISPGDEGRVFEEGFTTHSEGTGFGLAIVESILEAHGWRIELAEPVDAGARFQVEVPAVAGPDDGDG